jgi:glycosyltransferase involved in cell wall biosynthesis
MLVTIKKEHPEIFGLQRYKLFSIPKNISGFFSYFVKVLALFDYFWSSLMKNILFCVSSDVVTDQRVQRHCKTLINNGYSVTVVARKTAASLDLPPLPYRVKRFSMVFQTGPLFYAFFNLRLFFFLLVQPKSILWSNDLDTLVPCYLMKCIKKQQLVFDAHELFTDVPELENQALKKNLWKWVEKTFVPKADLRITVNQSLAEQFQVRYRVHFYVVRNVPNKSHLSAAHSREGLGIPANHLLCVLQGSGLNNGRGLTETVEAIGLLEHVSLLVIGSGNALKEAQNLCASLKLNPLIRFIPRLPYHEMMAYTQMADVGLAFDTHPCLNFQLALPNKIFDYFHAGIAVLCGPQPEISRLVKKYDCGVVMPQVTPISIAESLRYFQENPEQLSRYKQQSSGASRTEHWENEEQALVELLSQL